MVRSSSARVSTSEAPTGSPTGAKSALHRGQQCILQGPKVTPESSINYSSEESLHQHHHPHHQGNSQSDELGRTASPKQIAARLTNELLDVAGIKAIICAEPALTRREYDKVLSWVNVGWNADAMLRSAELQMARRRRSGLVEPIKTVGYFEPEFRKVLCGVRGEPHSPRATGTRAT
jgi:hypothetical protein